MSDGMKLIMSKDGTFKKYDDTHDIVIHCESEEEHDRVIEKFNSMSWIPADQPPKPEECVLLSFENFSTPLVGMYREDSDGGAYYVGDDEESYISHDIVVNAWMPLPNPYREDDV